MRGTLSLGGLPGADAAGGRSRPSRSRTCATSRSTSRCCCRQRTGAGARPATERASASGGGAGADGARPAGAAARRRRPAGLRAARGPDRDARRRSVPRLHRGRTDGALPRHAQLGPPRRRGGVRGSAVDDPGGAAPARARRGGAPGARRAARRPTLERVAAATALKLSRPTSTAPRPAAARRSDRAGRAGSPRAELRVEPLRAGAAARRCATPSRIFAVLWRKRDVLLHHPYESFDPVVRFIEEAADDPNVLAIKQTLYRTSGDSPFVRALSRAAENGKQVTALVEIKARFDEANNIAWARRLEENGVHVVYGAHRPQDPLQGGAGGAARGRGHPPLRAPRHRQLQPADRAPVHRPVALHHAAPRSPTTSRALFNMLTGYSEPPSWKRLAVAPLRPAERILELIRRRGGARPQGRAGAHRRQDELAGRPGDDPRALRRQPGRACEIDLLVRGICCLRPGVPGVSERIRVHQRRRSLPRAQPRVRVRRRRTGPRSSSPRPTGCRATSCAASR